MMQFCIDKTIQFVVYCCYNKRADALYNSAGIRKFLAAFCGIGPKSVQ